MTTRHLHYTVEYTKLLALQSLIIQLQRRAKRLQLPAITMRLGKLSKTEIVWVNRYTGAQHPYLSAPDPITEEWVPQTRQWFDVELIGEAPMLEGWMFAATFTSVEGEPLILSLPDGLLPAPIPTMFWTGDPTHCQHCGASRRRNETYLLYHVERGQWKQVGSSCVKDFLGGVDPHAIAAQAEMWEMVGRSITEEPSSSGAAPPEACFPVLIFLAYVAAAVRVDGWVSRTMARADEGRGRTATVETVWQVLTDADPHHRDWRLARHPGSADEAEAMACMEWADEKILSMDPEMLGSDFFRNLRSALRAQIVTRRTAGLVASLVAMVQRERRKAAEDVSTSEFIGQPGERITLDVEVTDARYMDGEFGSTLLQFRDTAGNQLSWFASGSKSIEPGAHLTLTGTVKKHVIIHGHKVTNLTRCRYAAK